MSIFFRLFLGRQNVYASECFEGGFIGTDFGIPFDLSGHLSDTMRQFNDKFIPLLQELFPEKNRRSAGLACGMLWTVSKYFPVGAYVLCPTGTGSYRVGRVTSEYYFVEGQILPHRRDVDWLSLVLEKANFSEPLQNSIGSMATVCDISKYQQELDQLIQYHGSGALAHPLETGDVAVFALEKYLEDFIISNWSVTPFGQTHNIYEVDGEKVGRQLQTDTGPLDILAESKDGSEMLVIELKRDTAPEKSIGQILRYMAWVRESVAREGQQIRGIIIALEDDLRIRRALQMVQSVDFYRYEVRFSLNKVKVN